MYELKKKKKKGTVTPDNETYPSLKNYFKKKKNSKGRCSSLSSKPMKLMSPRGKLKRKREKSPQGKQYF